MKVVGRRFWTWMGVWVLSFFVKGDLLASPQEKPTTGQVTEGTTTNTHKVPRLKTQAVFPKTPSGRKVTDKTSSIDKTSPEITVNKSKVTSRTSQTSSGSENPTESLKTQVKTKPKHKTRLVGVK